MDIGARAIAVPFLPSQRGTGVRVFGWDLVRFAFFFSLSRARAARCGDDGVAIKSGLNEAGVAFATPSQHIRVQNVTVHPFFDNGSTNGVSIGSEMSGGVYNVTVSGLSLTGCGPAPLPH